ncbi:alpha/beta hydrolase [Modestobacter lapidis]|nr:alpha/beta hydrolase [Modestobacter lapidis]
MSRSRTAVVSLAVAVLVGSGTSAASAGTPDPIGPVPPVDLPWAGCGLTDVGVQAGVQCARIDVPLDHDDPAGAQVQIALARVPATDPAQRIGSLFFNFGGPGAAAVESLQNAGAERFAVLNQRFDIVAFDPRGVGKSSPVVDCQVGPGVAAPEPEPVPAPTPIDPGIDAAEGDAVDADALVAEAQRYVDACVAANGELLEHLSTANVARDLDMLRAAVGDAQLTYLGWSYGTFLGATYAALFPDRYRALVLDGALDPEQYLADPVALSTAQSAGFEEALDRFLLACAADQVACSGFGGSDPATAYDALLAAAAQTPIPADGYAVDPRPVTRDDVLGVTATLLYAKQAWGLLAAALAQGAAGDGSLLRAIVSQIVSPPDPDGSPDSSTDRFVAITAAERDWPRDIDSYLARGAREATDFPHFGSAYGELVWALWPVRDEDAYRGPFTVAPSSATPLVIGTTHDPATPYAGAPALVAEQGNARLLTMDGDGHTAYGGNSACIDTATEAYLVDLVLPAEGTVCAQEVPFEAPALASEEDAGTRTGVRLSVAAPVGSPVLGSPVLGSPVRSGR